MPPATLPVPGLGTYSDANREQWVETVRTALDVGYRHVDTAQGYDNEQYVGEGIATSSVDREDVFLATKVDPDNLARKDVRTSTTASLDRLGTEYLDLLYVHWPTHTYEASETLAALEQLHDDGAIRNIGLSNFTPALLDEAREVLDVPITAHQVECHPLLQQDRLREDAREHDHWLVAYSPLAQGEVFEEPKIQEIADKHGVSPAAVSLAWLDTKENVVPIPKASSREHLEANLAALKVSLDPEDVAAIDAIGREHRVIDPDFAPWNQ
ncbi:Aldehyde reductase protein [Halorhabdus tiamatea SARL4B]|uniref:Aldehyde reductase protein n=1 Tax=Halorhabdus tiamatea SARL4B TaxID=1033806 RepID=U2E4S5_9EURY|nr:aldo/keto reductase [Halorhabdus tiamatea]ERJ07233.1 Aldehyde reductase protein [Halorhabdus tiamatea SARL4B]